MKHHQMGHYVVLSVVVVFVHWKWKKYKFRFEYFCLLIDKNIDAHRESESERECFWLRFCIDIKI